MQAGPRKRVRLDRLVHERGLAPTRNIGRSLIMAGRIVSGERPLTKPGMLVDAEVELRVLPGRRYASRGGFKLARALERFELSVAGRVAIDVGASTGGFTDVLLQEGARTVIALDVGRGQLDWSLRNDPRVFPLEGLNARYLERSALPAAPDLAVVDVSFISLKLVLPPVVAALEPRWDLVALIKPQFEVGRAEVGRGGIVRDPLLHESTLREIAAFSVAAGWSLAGIAGSPVLGSHGNREFLVHLQSEPSSTLDSPDEEIRRIVNEELPEKTEP